MIESVFTFDGLLAVVDILIVATVIYYLMLLVKGARAERMIWGIGIIVLLYFFSQRAQLITLHWILNNFLGSIVIILVVVFQQDIRRALMQMGRPFSVSRRSLGSDFVEEIAMAVVAMSKNKTGALIAIQRQSDLGEFVESGVEIDSALTRDLLLSIFNPSSPLHDGAVIVRRERIAWAGAILPLSSKEFSRTTGTRHRAAMGLSEETDAVVIVVSERSGEITLAMDDGVTKGFDYDSLVDSLRKIFVNSSNARERRGFSLRRA